MHERRVGVTGTLRDLRHHLVGTLLVVEVLQVEQRRLDRRRHQGLQVAAGRHRVAVLGRDDLALLGDAHRTLHRTLRLGQDRIVGRAAAATDGAAAAVEQTQPDALVARHLRDRGLRVVQRPVRGEVAAVLVRVGVAEHDLLHVAAGGDVAAVQRHVPRRPQHRRAGLQVLDGLEQRHDVDGAGEHAVVDGDQPDLLEQDHRLQQIGDRRAHRDDALRHDLRTVGGHGVGGRAHDAQFPLGGLRQRHSARHQRASRGEFLREDLDAAALRQRPVILRDAGQAEQLGEDVLVAFGVLPQIQRVQVETEDVRGGLDIGETVIGDEVIVAAAQRRFDDVEVCAHFRDIRIRLVGRPVPLHDRMAETGHGGGGDATPDSVDGAAVRLVDPIGHVVLAPIGQLHQVDGNLGEAVREAQLTLQGMQLLDVVAQDRRCGAVGGVADDLLRHVRVAVVVAADPRAHPHHRGLRHVRAADLAHGLHDVAVEPGHSLQQRQLVVAQADLNLVADVRAIHADQRGLPQRHDAPADLQVQRRDLRVRAGGARGVFDLVTGPHRGADVLLHVEHRAAARLRRVRGEHRHDLRDVHHRRQLGTRHPRLAQLLPRRVEGRITRRLARIELLFQQTLLVEILRQIRQQGEVRERPDDRRRLLRGDVPEQPGQLPDLRLTPMKAERGATRVLHEVEDVVALLLADHLTEDPPQMADVVVQRFVAGLPRALILHAGFSCHVGWTSGVAGPS